VICNVSETIGAANPVGRDEDEEAPNQVPADTGQVHADANNNEEHSPDNKPLERGQPTEKGEVQNIKDFIQNMQSLVKKLGPGLDKPNEPVPDDNPPKDALEGLCRRICEVIPESNATNFQENHVERGDVCSTLKREHGNCIHFYQPSCRLH
jgi:hypothetical protein